MVLLPGITGPGPREAVGAGANEVTAELITELAGLPGRVEVATELLTTTELLLTAAVVVAAAEEEAAEEAADDAAELLAAEEVAVGTVMVTPTDLQRASEAERALAWSEALQELWTQEVELLMKVLLEHAHLKSVTLQLVWAIPVVRQVKAQEGKSARLCAETTAARPATRTTADFILYKLFNECLRRGKRVQWSER